MANLSSTDLDLDFQIKLRECAVGEQFTSVGKCQKCENGYSIV